MENEAFRISFSEPVEIDPFKLPPLFGITGYPSIQWMLAQATSKKHKKHIIAMIILGQPFNRKK